MILYLHPYIIRYAGQTFGRHIGLDVRDVHLLQGGIPKDGPSADIAEAVVRHFEDDESRSPDGLIDLLVIVADGGPGYMKLSGGEHDDQYLIDVHNAEEFAAPFARLLKPRSHGGEGVEIHACGIAGPSRHPVTGEVEDAELGLRFVARLAVAFGQRVLASGDPALVEIDELFEDSLVEAQPSEDQDGDGDVRVLRDVTFAMGSGRPSRIESFMGDTAARSAVERYYGR